MGLLRTCGSLLPGDACCVNGASAAPIGCCQPPTYDQMGVRVSIESRFTMLVKGENGRSENRVCWTTGVLETKLCFVLPTEQPGEGQHPRSFYRVPIRRQGTYRDIEGTSMIWMSALLGKNASCRFPFASFITS